MTRPDLLPGSRPALAFLTPGARRSNALPCLVLAYLLWQTAGLVFAQALSGPLPGQTKSPSAPATEPAKPAAPAPSGQTAAPPADGRLESIPAPPPVKGIARSPRATASDLVAESLRLPQSTTLFGQPLPLVSVLASAQSRARQPDAIRTYWHLAAAVAHYRFCLDQNQRLSECLRRIANPTPAEAAALSAARAAALEAERSAELDVVRVQHELVESAGLATTLPPPLPADLPLASPYDAKYQQVSASRTLVPRAALIDRLLPVRLEAIQRRSAAVKASEDLVEAVTEVYIGGRADLPALLAALADSGRQRRALMAEVCRYNDDIAEYVVAVVGSTVSAQQLVTLLIKPTSSEPAASPAGASPDGGPEGPTLAPPRGTTSPSNPAPNSPSPPSPPSGAVPVRTVQFTPDSPRGADSSLALYASLNGKSPAMQAKEVSKALHAQGTGLSLPGEPITLRDCLASIPASLRPQTLDAYWLAWQLAAECRTLAAEQSQLDQLVPFAMERGSRPGGNVEGLRLHAASTAVAADFCDSRARLLEAEFDLTRLLQRPLAKDWLLPVTPPHVGPYLTKLELLPPQAAQSQVVERVAAAIPLLWDSTQRRAKAVVDADAARAAATAAYRLGSRPVDQLLPCIQQQAMETLAFLETITALNRSIAQYVLIVVPIVVPGTLPADRLVQTLVLAE